MKKSFEVSLRLLLIFCVVVLAHEAKAFTPTYYAASSALASGRWVKVSVDTTGVAEISYKQLHEMGFSNPAKVRIVGRGGNVLPQAFTTELEDDYAPVSVYRLNDKIYFYALGVTSLSPRSVMAGTVFQAVRNTCSTKGYYFITDADLPEKTIETRNSEAISTAKRKVAFDVVYHEREISNPGNTGKMFLGENFGYDLKLAFDVECPGIVEESPMLLYSSFGYLNSSRLTALIADYEGTEFEMWSNTINYSTNSNDYYIVGNPSGIIRKSLAKERGVLSFKGVTTDTPDFFALDYFTLLYTRRSVLNEATPSINLYYDALKSDESLSLKVGAGVTPVWWNVSNPRNPVAYRAENISGESTIAPGVDFDGYTHFVAFNPDEKQLQVEFVEEVKSQNLHALPTPELLIITTERYMHEALRLADVHKEKDGIEVVVVDHRKIFNEFSYGTPDVTAYRRFAKMLYDRAPEKLKNILFVGSGSYDNRNLRGIRDNDDILLTYQSDAGARETNSYVTDDYFGFLGDDTSTALSRAQVKVGVGRLPVTNISDLRIIVDKIIRYMNDETPGEWRNNLTVLADEGEDNLFAFQTEGIDEMMSALEGSAFNVNKVLVASFPKEGGTSVGAKSLFRRLLQKGQLYATYIGHGGPAGLTYNAKAWTVRDVKDTEYPRVPIMSLATCDVSRWDSDQEGIAQLMLRMPNGGAIALLSPSRTVFADENDLLNRAFMGALLAPDENGTIRTIGESFRIAKSSIQGSDANKLNFALLGDPAIRPFYPRKGVKISKINGRSVEEACVAQNSFVEIEGEIHGADGNKDAEFNGTVNISFYGTAYKFGDVKASKNSTLVRESFMNNECVGSVVSEVKSGKFSAKIALPPLNTNGESYGKISLYALSEDEKTQLSGLVDKIILVDADDQAKPIDDTSAPEFNAIYINTPDFVDGDLLSGKLTLHAEVTDNTGVMTNVSLPGCKPEVKIDGKQNVGNVGDYVRFVDGNLAVLDIELPRLDYGLHTVVVKFYDANSNGAERVLNFYYGDGKDTVDVNATINHQSSQVVFSAENAIDLSDVTLKVVDRAGNPVWQKKSTTLPTEWDMKGVDGVRVSPGIYRYYVTASTSRGPVASGYKNLIVLKQ